MELLEEDWAELLAYMRRRVRASGFAEIDDRAMSDFGFSEHPSRNLLRYVERVAAVLAERSFSTFDRAINLMRETILVEGGGTVQGVEIVFNERERQLYGLESFDLSTVEDHSALVDELRTLSRYLEQRLPK